MDTDGNGKPEIFFAGAGPGCNLTHVYESTGDNAFQRVAVLLRCDMGGVPSSCIANTDGVGRPEYVWWLSKTVKAYEGIAPGQWIVSAFATDPDPNGIHTAVKAYDINENGRDEVYWASQSNAVFTNTLVLERAALPTDAGAMNATVTACSVRPTPCRTRASVRFTDAALARSATWLAVFDVAGRLVLRERVPLATRGEIEIPLRSLRPGFHFIRVEDSTGRSIAVARTVVVR